MCSIASIPTPRFHKLSVAAPLTASHAATFGRAVLIASSACAILLGAMARTADAQPVCAKMYDLSSTPGPAPSYSRATAVSENGSVVVGFDVSPDFLTGYAVRWVASGVPGGGNRQVLGTLNGDAGAIPYAVSADGKVVVGYSSGNTYSAFSWTQEGGMIDLGSFAPGSQTVAWGVTNASEVIVVGGSFNAANQSRAFRWRQQGGMQDIGTLGGTQAEARAVSRNGNHVVGSSTTPSGAWHAFSYFTSELFSAMTDLGTLPGYTASSVATAVSANGQVVVGYSTRSDGASHGFRWTEATGMQDLGTIGRDAVFAFGISGDGNVIVGMANDPLHDGNPRAVKWTAATGWRDIGTLSEGGEGFAYARAISADGGTVVGESLDTSIGRTHAFRVGGDTDGDGLLDDWECNGIPYADAGGLSQRYMLPGANWLHKDLYVEVDAMRNFSFDPAAVPLLQTAFADAPLSNPDLTTGINLHLVLDQTDLPLQEIWQSDADEWPSDQFIFRFGYFGTESENSDSQRTTAKAKAFRYCIVADRSSSTGLVGIAQLNGDNMVVYHGSGAYTAEEQAGIFMHEFGHNLGLKHGGDQNTNGKPNYPSVMNYVLAWRMPWNTAFWKLDYSRSALDNINEEHLDELIGIGTPAGPYQSYVMPYGFNSEVIAGQPIRRIQYARLNGSPVDFGNVQGTEFLDGLFTLNVIQDLNYIPNNPVGLPGTESPGQLHRGWNDWEHVVLPLRTTRGTNALAVTYPTDEPTVQGRDWMRQNFPLPCPGCPVACSLSDVAGGGATGLQPDGVVDGNDFIAFINSFSTGDPAVDGLADVAGGGGNGLSPDGIIDGSDFIAFINAFSAGC